MHRLFLPVDIASLVYFRIVFGMIMFWEVCRYFAKGWIKRHFIDPPFHFHYYGFDWVEPWPGDGMYWHFLALGLLCLLIAAGLWYRVSTVLFFLGFSYVFLLDPANYLNHFYLVILFSFLMIFVPAHRALSLDAWRNPALRSTTAPAWALWALRGQMGIVYFYAGLAKLNWDWLQGQPMRMWLYPRTDFPLVGQFFRDDWMVYLASYAGLLLDLLIVPLLLWRRTRLVAFGLAVVFHLTNSDLFSIGIFPWLALAATALFFPADWPRRWFDKCWRLFLTPWRRGEAVSSEVCGETPLPPTPLPQGERGEMLVRGAEGMTQASCLESEPIPVQSDSNPLEPDSAAKSHWPTVAFLGVYFTLQLLIPLRHFLYPGNVSWTEEGHNFSWHMKLRSKGARAQFYVYDPVTDKWQQEDPANYLTRRQFRKMSTRPDMILQFSHYLASQMRNQGRVEVYAAVRASLNGRKPQLLVSPNVDLAAQPRSWQHAPWIVPLEEPLSGDWKTWITSEVEEEQ